MERTDFEQWKAKEVARLLALVETERRYYQEMVASLPVALAVLSSDRSIVSANRAFRRTFGIRTDDLRRKTIDQILPSAALVERIRDVQMHAEAQPSFIVELEERRLRIAVVPIRNWDDEGEVETLLTVQEVSAPEESPSRPAAAIPAATLDVAATLWKADPHTLAFTSVSGAAEQLLGYPVAHWLSTPQFFRERIHPDDRAATMAFYETAIERLEGDASAEFRAVAASGAVVWCRETVRVSSRAITGVLTDVTLRRQLEQQMLSAERSEALHAVSSRLAHDLNNPLMIITGYGEEMLQTLPAQDAMRADVQQILTATERISGIAAQLLNFTRRIAERPHPVNVSALLAGLEEKISAGEPGVVEIEPASEPLWAMVDARQLEEVVLALTSAREGARERSRVSLGCAVEAIAEQLPGATLKPGVYTRLSIRDDGRGTEATKGVFETALAGKDPGASRAYSIVREWGGDIAFSSEPFRGSLFLIYLPYAEPEAAPVVAPPAAAPEPEPEPAKPARTILLVEDEAGIRALVRKILRREHYNVLEAGTAEEAINVAAAQESRIDLLVTDVMLPGMSGRELAEGMSATLPDLKVLYVSGFTDDEAVRAGAFPPGAKFLQKPFTLSALVGKVREALAD